MIAFGNVPLGAVLPIVFSTYGKTNGESITLTGLAVTDIEIYKGTSMTQRSSDAGYTLLDTDGIDIDGITGIHGFSIDTGDNTDAGFYAAGSFYTVVVSAVTVDSQTVNFVAATFRLVAAENVAGVPVGDVSHLSGDSAAADNAEAFFDGTGYAGTGNTIPTVTNLTNKGDGSGFTAIPWNASWDAEVQSEVQDAIEANHLDHLLAATYDPASKPGAADALLNELVESDAGVSRFTANALEQAPAGTGATAQEVWEYATRTLTALDEDSTTIDLDAAIRAAVGLSAANLDTQLSTIDDFLDTEVAAILAAVDTEVAAILALLDDARGEPGQGNPPVNPDLATKIDYLYKAWRNRKTQTSTEFALYADDAVTKDQEAPVSDDGTTFEQGEMRTGA